MRSRRQRGANVANGDEDNEPKPMPRTRSGKAAAGGNEGFRLLEDMIRSGHCDELAIELTKEATRAKINTCNGDSALLHIASRMGNNAAIDLLLDAGADLNLKDQSSLRQTPLDVAYNSNQQKTAIYLLEKGANFTQCAYTKDR
jgi:ankyrin repeat protein